MRNVLYKMYSTDLKKEKKKKKRKNGERNQKHVFVPDEELEEEARVLEKVRKKAAIVATSVHETANLSDSDEPVCTTGLRGGAFPKFGPKYEIRARVNIGVDARLFDVNGVTARSRYRNVSRVKGESSFVRTRSEIVCDEKNV